MITLTLNYFKIRVEALKPFKGLNIEVVLDESIPKGEMRLINKID